MNPIKITFALSLLFLPKLFYCDRVLSQSPAAAEASGAMMPLSLIPRWNKESPWIVDGRVVDHQKRPCSKAKVALIAELYTMDSPNIPPRLIAEGNSDANGNFRLTTPSLEWYQCRVLTLMIHVDGQSTFVKSLKVPFKQQSLGELVMIPSRTVKGKLLNAQGTPLSGVQLDIASFSIPDTARYKPGESHPAAWPASVVTNAQGEFSLSFLPTDTSASVELSTLDKRLSPAPLYVNVDVKGSDFEITCEAGSEVHGQVVCQDTGKPLGNTWINVVSLPHDFSRGADQQNQGSPTRTNGEGKFVVNCRPGKFVTVYVYPTVGLPYPAWMEQQPMPEDVKKNPLKVQVPRGVLVRGRVVEETSGKGVFGAGVEYLADYDDQNPMYPRRSNPYVGNEVAHQVYWATERHRELTDDSGNFQIAVLPGKGHLMVKAPTDEYESQNVSRGELFYGEPKLDYYCMESLQAIDPMPSDEPLQITLALRLGRKVSGTLAGPKKEPIAQALLLSPTYSPLWINEPNFRPRPVQTEWQIRGVVAGKPTPVSFFDLDHECGATIDLNALKDSDQRQTVQLVNCGTAKAKLVDQESTPFGNYPYVGREQPLCILVVEAVPAASTSLDPYWLTMNSDSIHWAMEELASERYRKLSTDKDGNIVFPLLIPDAQYVLYTYNAGQDRMFFKERKRFKVAAGEQLDLGTILTVRE